MSNGSREEQIAKVITRIERSPLSAEAYIQRYGAPFSLRQFYRYRARLSNEGEEGLKDKRSHGNHRKLSEEEMTFLRGFVKNRERVTPSEAQRVIAEDGGTEVHLSTMSRVLKKLGAVCERRRGEVAKKEHVSGAGLELVGALAVHLGWPEHTARYLMEGMEAHRGARQPSAPPDRYGRNAKGQFTKKYHQRAPVRKMRFASIELKRSKKDLRRMDLFKTSAKNLERKSLAVLALPLVTLNGASRHVNTATGNALKGFCGYNYKQATVDRFLRELKYLGASEWLLGGQIRFWKDPWSKEESELEVPFLCYYIDGNTKPVWSSQPVKKNKVSMLGRVMGCLEQVFVHDGLGHPIYFETYSGHGPMGVYTLSLMEKVERYMEGTGGPAQVSRVLVMDGASNSVETLRAFASQDRYYYITTLDANQWSERKVRQESLVERYRCGDATLYDGEIEWMDSKEKGYLVMTRVVRVEWDSGKSTVLLTNLPAKTIRPSWVVKGYFDRWPQQELVFRGMNNFASLRRVAGYGKQRLEDPEVRAEQQDLQEKIKRLRDTLKDPLAEMAQKTAALAALIEQERVLRAKSRIEEGKRIWGKKNAEALRNASREIERLRRRIKAIEKDHEKAFKKLHRYESKWMRLQGKEIVYKVDVELDQMVTYFRVSLSNLWAYFLKEFLRMGPTSFSTLMQSVLLLDGDIEETRERRKVTLKRNPKDPAMMKKLEAALVKLNALSPRTLSGKQYEFALS